MKLTFTHLVVSILLLAPKVGLCQIDTTTFYGKMNYVFQHTNTSTSQISTGLLEDYGIDFLNLDNYTGLSISDSNFTGLCELRCLYASIYSFQISTNGIAGLDTLNQKLNTYNSITIPVHFATLYYSYQYIDPNAVTNHLMTVTSGQVYDVSGRTQSPYDSKEVFAVAPIVQGLPSGTNELEFTSDMFFSNTGKTVSSIQVDPYGTGTYQSVTYNTPISVTYDTLGFYNINVKYTFTDGTVRLGHTKVSVYGNPSGTGGLALNNRKMGMHYLGTGPPFIDLNHFADALRDYSFDYPLPSTKIVASRAYLGVKDTAYIVVQLSTKNTSGQLKKPLIVVEGFDTQDPTPEYPGAYPETRFVEFSAYDYNQTPAPKIPLNHGLDSSAYDIVYVHFINGTDYIERNAYLLESVIQYVNSIKAPHFQNVIIAQSMGGLITRYALRDMERLGLSHDTRLFISHDVPYWGANVPVGAQAMVQHLAAYNILGFSNHPISISWVNLFPSAQTGTNLLNSAGAKEMIIQNYTLGTSTPGVTLPLTANNGAHIAFFDTLNAMGWPANCRNVTVSNGACNGALKFPDGSTMVALSTGSGRSLTYFGQLWQSLAASVVGGFGSLGLVNGYSSMQFSPLTELIQFPLAIFSSKTSVNLNFNFTAVPATGTSTIYTGQMYIHRTLLGIININTYLIDNNANSTSDMLPIDNVAGSATNLSQFGLSNNLSVPKYFKGYIDSAVILEPNFCFVPTVSSAAFTSPTSYLRTAVCNNYTCYIPAAVADAYIPNYNSQHITFTADNAAFILSNQDSTFHCDKLCPASMSFVGSDTAFCTTGSWSLTGLPSGATVNWSLPYGDNTVTLNCSPCTTVTATKGNTGTTTLTASFPDACGVMPSKSEELIVGPVVFGTYSAGPSGPYGQPLPTTPYPAFSTAGYILYQLSLSNTNLTGVSWSYTGTPAPTTFSGYGTGLNMEVEHTGEIEVTLNATHPCGTVANTYPFVSEITGGDDEVVVSPNPASDNLLVSTAGTAITTAKTEDAITSSTVTAKAENAFSSSTTTTGISGIKIFNAIGILEADLRYPAPVTQVHLSTKSFVSGVYFIEIMTDDHKLVTKKVIVQH